MSTMRFSAQSIAVSAAAVFLLLVGSLPSQAASPGSSGPVYPNGGYAPTGAEQSASWTVAQAQSYANKLAREATVTGALGFAPSIEPYRPAWLPAASAAAMSPAPAFPITGSVPAYNDAEPNSYYGYQCGPAAGHNALGAFGINYPVGTGSYPNATYLTQQMHTDTTNGTSRTYMPGALNADDNGNNTYVWQNIASTGDVSYYTSWDIWAMDAPLYNIWTYGYDPIQKKYRYPFKQWPVLIKHYVVAYAYRSSAQYISISDSAVYLSHTAAQRYEQYYVDIWVAINNVPLTNQILF
jgi:hypothetical protein